MNYGKLGIEQKKEIQLNQVILNKLRRKLSLKSINVSSNLLKIKKPEDIKNEITP